MAMLKNPNNIPKKQLNNFLLLMFNWNTDNTDITDTHK